MICDHCQLETGDLVPLPTLFAAPGADDDRIFCKPCFQQLYEYHIDEAGHYIITSCYRPGGKEYVKGQDERTNDFQTGAVPVS